MAVALKNRLLPVDPSSALPQARFFLFLSQNLLITLEEHTLL